jgi:hypothetical protein
VDAWFGRVWQRTVKLYADCKTRRVREFYHKLEYWLPERTWVKFVPKDYTASVTSAGLGLIDTTHFLDFRNLLKSTYFQYQGNQTSHCVKRAGM